ncbi:polysulfide reductase [Sphaerisporangium melleum]|uniref:Polysulfide reductase n=1 Tax=Sphaerisporangium melleum TaxID=321316 RepID=A0A917VF76_9ACTN|nr:NrfD/PsrC family molybdoenzyme membrane anchor subunit [Sphaerisporangium melleum]GGK73737.1 polysulfide reductase [Sphaerisporangium melleum]GII70824.1 polysulfide reductase [Sphaerisporangium melleum]
MTTRESAGDRAAGTTGQDGRRFASYYDRHVVKPPVWHERYVGGYLYLGGLAGASSVLAAGAELTGRPRLARAGKVAALTGISLSAAALIADLGRPERFVNMLRTFKPTSPMNMGSWLLAAYGPLAGAGAVTDLTGRFPAAGRAACYGAALLGPAVATYTAVLIGDTAVPAWHGGHREMPFMFAGSAMASAAGAALLAAPAAENAPARHAAVLGTVLELAAGRLMRRRMGMVAETYERGRAGSLLRAAETLGVLGAAGALAAARAPRPRAIAALSGAALLAASACLRLGVFAAGVASAEDPRYTVVPQRERLSAAAS